MKKFAAVGLVAALFAVPAVAQAQAFVQAEAGLDVVSAEGESEANIGYGATVGYDMPLSGGMFVGVQATYADSETKRCARDAGEKICLEAGRDVAVLARLGTSLTEQSKLYVMGGYANARAEVNYYDDGVDGVAGVRSDLDGFRLGAGYQYDINDKFFVKAEYRYSNYQYDVSRHGAVIALGAKF
ncbi:outer membrane protein [Novosphingobium resinovorum]|uniref:outer membrane protein n=1 Tax=Novosphingobium resinovorum TaxID=158500 RepID=UPI002ED0DF99|nr:outer membrane beta-barrel protein [Novosphingobium resinovorum]